MKTTIQDIFREIQPEGSFSMARRRIVEAGVKFNGEQVTCLTQEVEVEEGSTFELGKRQTWRWYDGEWIRGKWDGFKGLNDDEVTIPVGDGSTMLVFRPDEEGVGYVRFADTAAPHIERVFWNCDEWCESQEQAQEVMGCIMHCIKNGAVGKGTRGNDGKIRG